MRKIVLLILSLTMLMAQDAMADGDNGGGNWPVINVTKAHSANPDVPMAVVICGEQVLLDRIDMYERLDRELTQITFGHSNLMLSIKRANRYFPIIVPILKKNGIPEDFAYLAVIESYLNTTARSGAGACGMWQFMKETGKQYGLVVNDEVDERYDPWKSTVAACKYLKAAYAKYKHWPTVAASYNGGMGRISKELERQLATNSFDLYLTEETSRYVFRFIAMKLIMENPPAYGIAISANQLYTPVEYTEVKVTGRVASWSQWAKKHGITYMQLRELNPWIRAQSLTNKEGRTYTVKIPKQESLYRSKVKQSVYNPAWVVQ